MSNGTFDTNKLNKGNLKLLMPVLEYLIDALYSCDTDLLEGTIDSISKIADIIQMTARMIATYRIE